MKKLAIVKQHGIKDCAPACIKSILIYYGGYLSIEKIRMDAMTNEEGTSAFHVIEVFKKYGFDAKGVKATLNQIFLEDLILPCIAHVTLSSGLQHYLVIYKIVKNNLIIMDPAKGKIILNKQDFEKIFTGLLIIVHPKRKIIQIDKMQNWKELLYQYYKDEQKNIKPILFYATVILTFNIIFSLYFRYINNYFEFKEKSIYLLILVILISLMLKNISTYLMKEKKIYVEKNIEVNNLFEFIKHIYYLPQPVLNSYSVGELMTRIYESFDLSNLLQLFLEAIINLILSIPILIIVCIISWQLTIFFFLIFCLQIIVIVIKNALAKKEIPEIMESQANTNHFLLDQIKNMKTIRHLNKTGLVLKELEHKLILFLRQKLKYKNTYNLMEYFYTFLEDIFQYGLIIIGLYLIDKQKLEFISLLMFQQLITYLQTYTKDFLTCLKEIPILKMFLVKRNDLLLLEREKQDGVNECFSNGSILFENITFSYDQYVNVLTNFNLEIKRNEHILLMGKSGRGKSTLCQMLNGNVSNYQGEIKINQKNIKDYHLQTLRKNIVYLSQSEDLFDATIKENISFYKEINTNQFDAVCKVCEIEDIIKSKPFRYDTLIQNDIKCLSGGEKQRIMLARTLLEDRYIYILDEALSEVEDYLCKKIIEKVRLFLKNKTLIYVSHKNISFLFDRVVYMN